MPLYLVQLNLDSEVSVQVLYSDLIKERNIFQKQRDTYSGMCPRNLRFLMVLRDKNISAMYIVNKMKIKIFRLATSIAAKSPHMFDVYFRLYFLLHSSIFSLYTGL